MLYKIVNAKFNDKVLALSKHDNETVIGFDHSSQSNQTWSIHDYNGLSVIKNVGTGSPIYLGEQNGRIIGVGSHSEDQAPRWDVWPVGRYSRILLGNLFLELRGRDITRHCKEVGFAPGEYDDDAQLWELVPVHEC
ncbi:hypothetical protein E4T56_gene18818 [Termitomyces sp. T112]|nr:hypothetical protein E4T56_gene18818 [Termitomyces sp. T112]KAH0580717.1 hypothetical protein H2248_002203 [Termitomyces sp. 'cryptogamus']